MIFYQDKEYSNRDIGELFLKVSSDIFKTYFERKDNFTLFLIEESDYKREVELDFVKYEHPFIFNFKIKKILGNDTISQIIDIKRKRDKRSLFIEVNSVFLDFSSYQENYDISTPVVVQKNIIKFNQHSWASNDFEKHYERQLDFYGNFIKGISKNKKKKLLKFCLKWDKLKTDEQISNYWKMLTEDFGLGFGLNTQYFSEAVETSTKRVIHPNKTYKHNLTLETNNYRHMRLITSEFAKNKLSKLEEAKRKYKDILDN